MSKCMQVVVLAAIVAGGALPANAWAAVADFDAASGTSCSLSASIPTESSGIMTGRAILHCDGPRPVSSASVTACLGAQIGGAWVTQNCATRTLSGSVRGAIVPVSSACRALTLFRTEATATIQYAFGRSTTMRVDSLPIESICGQLTNLEG